MSLGAGGLWELVEARAAKTPDALLAVDEDDRTLTFAAYRDAALRTAAALRARGVGPGVRVSWMLPSTLEALVLVGALARLGAVQNPVLPIYRERELGFVLRELRPRLLVVPGSWRGVDYPALAARARGAAAEPDVLVLDHALPEADPAALGDLDAAAAAASDAGAATAAWAHGPKAEAGSDRVGSDAPSDPTRWVFYTSGTTADPKGARHGDTAILAAARGMTRALALRPDDRVAMVFPLTHVGGIVWLAAALDVGCRLLVVPAFDPKTTPRVLARHGVTQATAGTVFHQAYLAAQREQPDRPLFPRVRAFPGGGAPKPPALHFALRTECGGAGVVSGYGMTEFPIATMGRVTDPDEKLAHTEGRAVDGVEIRIVRPGGTEAAPGEEGEIELRGPQRMLGYVDPAREAEALTPDGFLRTGDLGRLDGDGHLVVTGRVKDVIIRKGENVSAVEVEAHLHEHPKVAEAAVVGLPDPERGERVCAVVACRDPGAPLGFDEMVAFLAGRGLMRQKLPEQLELVPALPRNASGKVRKRELRERYAS